MGSGDEKVDDPGTMSDVLPGEIHEPARKARSVARAAEIEPTVGSKNCR